MGRDIEQEPLRAPGCERTHIVRERGHSKERKKKAKQAAWGLGLVAFVVAPLCVAVVAKSMSDNSDGLETQRQLSGGSGGSLGGCTSGNTSGMIVLYIIAMTYLFIGLAVVCDDFFVASLEALSEYFNLSEDVAGATFMAAGSSAPELFTSLVDTFYFESNVGVGTIVGSAVFNILVIIAMSAAAAKTDLHIDYRPLLRDIFFYLVSIALLLGTCWPKEVPITLENTTITLMSNNTATQTRMQGEITHWKAALLVAWYLVYLLFMKFNAKLLGMDKDERKEEENDTESDVRKEISAVGMMSYDVDTGISQPVPHHAIADSLTKTDDEKAGEDQEESEGGMASKLMDLAIMPWTLIFTVTIPNCGEDKWKKWFLVTFINSCLWIAIISWVLVLCATNFGCLVGLGPIIMGVVFLAAGTSVPDAISSVVVAREGLGGMAVANAIGSNVFDICLGLGIPYLIATVCMPGKFPYVAIQTDDLLVNILILVGTVVAVLSVLLATGWKLTKRLGWILLGLYMAFVVYNIVLEATGTKLSV